jgi:hypothetical protein
MRPALATVLAALVATLSVFLAEATPATAGLSRDCLSIKLAANYGRTEVSSIGVPCRRADRLARAWSRRRLADDHSLCMWRDGSNRPGRCTVDGWRCLSSHTTDGSTYQVVCRAQSRRRVRWTMVV